MPTIKTALQSGTYSVYLGDKGFVRLEEKNHNHGFYVALSGGIDNVPLSAMSEEFLWAVIDSWYAESRFNASQFFGYWVDTETNTASLDVVVWVRSPINAMGLAVENNQKAIWDCANQQEIRVS